MDGRSTLIVAFLMCYIADSSAADFTFDADWNTCENKTIEVVFTKELGQTVIVDYEILEAPAGPPGSLTIGIGGGPTSNGLSAFRSEYDPTKDYIIYYREHNAPGAPIQFVIVTKCTTPPPPTDATTGATPTDPTPTGNALRDPHMTTFDGVRYNFQGLCTYVLTQDCSDIHKPSFQVTADFREKRSKPLTRINAVNVNVDGMQLLRILQNNSFLIQDQLFTNSSAVIGNGQGTVKVEDEHVYVKLDSPALSLVWTKETHGINIALNGPNMRGNVCGLLGNANGDPEDDLMKSDGVIVTKDDIYEFGDSWMVPGSCE
ncbi:kielin/chordin-like protein [Saccoglossus kowalevskii]